MTEARFFLSHAWSDKQAVVVETKVPAFRDLFPRQSQVVVFHQRFPSVVRHEPSPLPITAFTWLHSLNLSGSMPVDG